MFNDMCNGCKIKAYNMIKSVKKSRQENAPPELSGEALGLVGLAGIQSAGVNSRRFNASCLSASFAASISAKDFT